MRQILWKEKHPLRGRIRRTLRAITTNDLAAYAVVVGVMAVMIISTMIQIGERPSGPVAGLSVAPLHEFSSVRNPPAVPGHGPYTIASRVDHGHLVGGEE